MNQVTLGTTGITVPQASFGALPVQRVNMETAVEILRAAYDGGMRFYDTARAYTDSEEKVGNAFAGMRDKVYIATKTHATTPEELWKDLNTSLEKLQTDYIDIYQLHMAAQCYRPGDGTGMYEALQEAKAKGLIRHIGITTHKIGVAEEIAESGLYETLQFPFSYIGSERDFALVEKCRENNVGFIAMKGLAGGLLTDSKAIMAFMNRYPNVVAIFGIQRMSELREWLSFYDGVPEFDDRIKALIEKDRAELSGDFCRGCGYCMPCPAGINIPSCARMSLMLRRAPSASSLTPQAQEMMNQIEQCLQCGQCMRHCPYELNTPDLLKRNLADYRRVLAGEVSVG